LKLTLYEYHAIDTTSSVENASFHSWLIVCQISLVHFAWKINEIKLLMIVVNVVQVIIIRILSIVADEVT